MDGRRMIRTVCTASIAHLATVLILLFGFAPCAEAVVDLEYFHATGILVDGLPREPGIGWIP